MTWVRLDDHFDENPKIERAGPLAAFLYICGLSYCARNLTDGFILAEKVRRLAAVPKPDQQARRLVDVGLWEEVEGGYQVHDYATYNPTRETVLSHREIRAEAGRIGGLRSGERRRAASKTEAICFDDRSPMLEANGEAKSNESRTPYPIPYPVPVDLDPSVLQAPLGVQGEQPKSKRPVRAKSPAPPPVSDGWLAIIRDKVPKPSKVGLARMGVLERGASPPSADCLKDALQTAIWRGIDDPVTYAAGILRRDPEFRDEQRQTTATGADGYSGGGAPHREIRSAVGVGRETGGAADGAAIVASWGKYTRR